MFDYQNNPNMHTLTDDIKITPVSFRGTNKLIDKETGELYYLIKDIKKLIKEKDTKKYKYTNKQYLTKKFPNSLKILNKETVNNYILKGEFTIINRGNLILRADKVKYFIDDDKIYNEILKCNEYSFSSIPEDYTHLNRYAVYPTKYIISNINKSIRLNIIYNKNFKYKNDFELVEMENHTCMIENSKCLITFFSLKEELNNEYVNKRKEEGKIIIRLDYSNYNTMDDLKISLIFNLGKNENNIFNKE